MTDGLRKRSQDLNVLDCSLWREINVRMHAQEGNFPKSKRKSMDAFKERLRRTALCLPPSLVKKAAADMKCRCQVTSAAKGDPFTE